MFFDDLHNFIKDSPNNTYIGIPIFKLSNNERNHRSDFYIESIQIPLVYSIPREKIFWTTTKEILLLGIHDEGISYGNHDKGNYMAMRI